MVTALMTARSPSANPPGSSIVALKLRNTCSVVPSFRITFCVLNRTGENSRSCIEQSGGRTGES